MKFRIKNTTKLLLFGLACIAGVCAQGLEDEIEQSQMFNERASSKIKAFRERYRNKGPLVVPKDDEWAKPPRDEITVRKAVWDDFVTGLTTDLPSSPLWYLLHAAHLLRYYSRDLEKLARGIWDNTGDPKWMEFRDRYFKIIAPLMTEFTWKKDDPAKPAGYFYQGTHESVPPQPAGLMDRGGIFDASFPQDPWRPILPGGSENKYPHDTFAVKVALLKLFQPIEEDYDGQKAVSVSDSRFKLLWNTVKQAYDDLTPFVKEVAAAANKEKWTLGDPGVTGTAKVDTGYLQTREFRREDIGYQKYYKKFEQAVDPYDTREDPSSDAQSDFVVGLTWGHRFGTQDTSNIFVAYGIMLTAVSRAILTLMMDMLADIGLRANMLADDSVSSIQQNWGLPRSENFKVSRRTLEKWPEWVGREKNGVVKGEYVTTAYPISEEFLAAYLPGLRMIRERYRQEVAELAARMEAAE